MGPAILNVEVVGIDSIKPHPKNYRIHPEDQLAHLVQSLNEHGIYRNIVIAKDGTILAGHGVVQAARKSGLTHVPVVRLDVSPEDPSAIRILIGDNEIEHLAEQNDKLLAELLKTIKDIDVTGLLGTGFDEMMLANFAMVTKGRDEIKDFDAAAHWVGMPEYSTGDKVYFINICFRDEKLRQDFAEKSGLSKAIQRSTERTWSAVWPPEDRDDTISLRVDIKE